MPLSQRSCMENLDDGQLVVVEVPAVESKEVLHRIDRWIIPLMGVCYMLQFMDKLALSQATLLGLLTDLRLYGAQYSWCSAIFYFGYLLWSWPSSYLVVRFPTGRYLSVTVFFWGVVIMCHGACNNFAGLMMARFFLGVCEAAIAPGFGLIVSMFYTRKEQPARQGAWFMGNCFAAIIGGLIAYGLGEIDRSKLEKWRLLFLILGAVTAAYSFVMILLLPNSPARAIFLNSRSRQVAVTRTFSNNTGFMDTDIFVSAQIFDALRDPQTSLLFLYTISVMIANGGLTSFSAIIINGFGFSDLDSLLLQGSLGVAQLVFLILTSGAATFIPNTRLLSMIFNTIISMIGMIMVYTLHNPASRMSGLCMATAFGTNVPLALSLVSSNVGGFTKRSFVGATIFVGYCVGNIVGPQFFQASQMPRYPTGLKASLSGMAIGIAFLLALLGYYIWENKRRDRSYGPVQEPGTEEELTAKLSSETDKEVKTFRYVL